MGYTEKLEAKMLHGEKLRAEEVKDIFLGKTELNRAGGGLLEATNDGAVMCDVVRIVDDYTVPHYYRIKCTRLILGEISYYMQIAEEVFPSVRTVFLTREEEEILGEE